MEDDFVLQLSCKAQQYAWGKIGKQSKVAQLLSNNPNFTLEENKPYAELWMGTHPSGPSFVHSPFSPPPPPSSPSSQTLADWITKNKLKALGEKTSQQFSSIPFLLKVLSVNQPLSIQAHPHKELAAKLRQIKPQHYPDDNHKPELAIAVTPFEAFVDFQPLEEIEQNLKTVKEFCVAIGGWDEVEKILSKRNSNKDTTITNTTNTNTNTTDEHVTKAIIKELFTRLMNCPEKIVKEQIHSLVTRIDHSSSSSSSSPSPSPISDSEKLARRLHTEFPYDIGVFSAFILNHEKLEPGSAIYLAPNRPHAYLSGDLIECMSCSDNVVRAGLTPKFKDVETLCEMLTYEAGKPKPMKVIELDRSSSVYPPPIDEFFVIRTRLGKSDGEYSFPLLSGPAIVLVYVGEGEMKWGGEGEGEGEKKERKKEIRGGEVYFVCAQKRVKFTATSEENPLMMFVASCGRGVGDVSW